jgi:hypothetical protein
MGNVSVTIRDSTDVDITISTAKECKIQSQSHEIYDALAHITNGTMSLQETKQSTESTQSFVGEISGDLCVNDKWRCLCESQKIVVKIVYKLPESNIGIPKFQGLGHVIFRCPGKCTSVQLCLEDLVINGTTATGTYYGYFEKCFDIIPCNKTKADVCVTFFITCQLST